MTWKNTVDREYERIKIIWAGCIDKGEIEPIGGHLLWKRGMNDSGYGIMRLTLDQVDGSTKRTQVYVHRLAFRLANPSFDLDGGYNFKQTVSHLCNKKTCVEPSHLNLEPQIINNERKKCHNNKLFCSGHTRAGGEETEQAEKGQPTVYPPCILT